MERDARIKASCPRAVKSQKTKPLHRYPIFRLLETRLKWLAKTVKGILFRRICIIQTLRTFWATRILILRIFFGMLRVPNSRISRFQISTFPDLQVPRFPDFQTPPAPPAPAPDELSDPNLTLSQRTQGSNTSQGALAATVCRPRWMLPTSGNLEMCEAGNLLIWNSEHLKN